MALWKVVAKWAGGAIGSGFTNFYFFDTTSSAQAAADSCRVFLAAAYGSSQVNLPTGVNISFTAGVDVIDTVTGQLTGTVPVTAPVTISGSGTGPYAAPAGACVTWLTNGVFNGHRLRGRTFLVPMAGSAYDTDGTLSTTAMNSINTAAASFIAAAPDFVIWHRPTPGGGGGGGATVVSASRVADLAAVLTSRR